jgi:hypothetical protein
VFIEADFQREYGLDLSDRDVLQRMSWRRFLVLVRGLGPHSATHQSIVARTHMWDRGSRRSVDVIHSNPEATRAGLSSLFGRAPRGKEPH